MWVGLALLSALTLGLYDVAKKRSLDGNAVLPVLLCSTALSSLIFLPFILSSELGLGWFDGTVFDFPRSDTREQMLYIIKGVIVASTWTFGYYGLKHMPLTIAGPINASRPVLVLLGSILLFGERLNALQWIGVAIAFVSFFLLSRSSKKEGIDFAHNRWIACMVAAMVIGVVSALYDKYLMRSLSSVAVQAWSNST